jgi:hypothetical protein
MTTLAVGNRRLLRLAAILERVPRTREKDGAPKFYMGKFKHQCGSPSCAAGWWMHHNPARWTQRLTLRRSGLGVWDSLRREFALDAMERAHPFAKKWPRIPLEDSTILFSSDGCDGARTGKQAAKFIRRFVRWRTAEAKKARA